MSVRRWLRSSALYRPYLSLKYRLRSDAREDLFTGIYRDNIWSDPESRSGAGSNMAQTEVIRAELPPLLRRLGVQSLLDVPCGDFAWMQHVDLDGIDYIGGDIVGEMIGELQQSFARPGREFRRLDIVVDELPAVDAVMVRDLLLHLPTKVVEQAIANIKRSSATWVLVSHYPTVPANADIPMGQHRFLNMTLAPFGWPSPEHVIDERPTVDLPDKQLAVWRRTAL